MKGSVQQQLMINRSLVKKHPCMHLEVVKRPSASPAGSMCDQRKIHVFLGAPPPACSPASEPGAGLEEDDRAAARWRRLELTWRDGQLRPAGEAFRDQTGGRSTHCCFGLIN